MSSGASEDTLPQQPVRDEHFRVLFPLPVSPAGATSVCGGGTSEHVVPSVPSATAPSPDFTCPVCLDSCSVDFVLCPRGQHPICRAHLQEATEGTHNNSSPQPAAAAKKGLNLCGCGFFPLRTHPMVEPPGFLVRHYRSILHVKCLQCAEFQGPWDAYLEHFNRCQCQQKALSILQEEVTKANQRLEEMEKKLQKRTDALHEEKMAADDFHLKWKNTLRFLEQELQRSQDLSEEVEHLKGSMQVAEKGKGGDGGGGGEDVQESVKVEEVRIWQSAYHWALEHLDQVQEELQQNRHMLEVYRNQLGASVGQVEEQAPCSSVGVLGLLFPRANRPSTLSRDQQPSLAAAVVSLPAIPSVRSFFQQEWDRFSAGVSASQVPLKRSFPNVKRIRLVTTAKEVDGREGGESKTSLGKREPPSQSPPPLEGVEGEGASAAGDEGLKQKRTKWEFGMQPPSARHLEARRWQARMRRGQSTRKGGILTMEKVTPEVQREQQMDSISAEQLQISPWKRVLTSSFRGRGGGGASSSSSSGMS